MQTLDFTHALTDIVADLKVRELYLLLQALLVTMPEPSQPNWPQQPIQDVQKAAFTELLLASYAGYDRMMRAEVTRRILEGMEARALYSAARLNRMMQLVNNSPTIGQIRSGGNPNSTEVFDFYQTLGAFLKVEKTCRTLLQDEKVGKVEPTDSLLELQLTDYEGKGVEPARLSAAFSILADLQMNIARLLQVKDDRLTVKYLDSGSDFKFGVEGLKEPIEALRNLIESIWDRIRFRDQDSFERNMEAVTKGLDFMEKVKKAVDSKAVTQEEADILKTRVFKEVNDLIGLGVTLPISGEGAAVERKQLIEKRSTKLLTAGDAAPAEPVVDPGPQQAD
jgi:hypothetical protein